MDAPDPPRAPDPVQTAQAQTESNRETAITNAYLNRINQTSPFGSVNYQVEGTNPDGSPRFSQTTSLSAPVQGLFDNYMGLQNRLGGVAQGQIGQLENQLAQPFDLSTASGDKMWELQRARLDPMFQQREDSLKTNLLNRGIREGTEAWDRSMSNFGQQRNDAYNQMALTGDQWATQKAMLERSAPLNEFNALLRGQQVGMPQFQGVPGVSQAGTDVAGIHNAAFQNQMAAYNAQNNANNAFMGGLFGMGTSLLTAPMTGGGSLIGNIFSSDVRLKKDIVATGEIGPKGLPVVEWTYVWGGPRYRGYIAQDVLQTHPEAVYNIGGYLALDYARIV